MAAPARRNPLTLVLLVLIVIMGCEILYLIHQNRQLQAMLARAPFASRDLLEKGQQVPPLRATALDGGAVAIQYGQREPSTLLIWFSPSCHVCAENAVFWNDLYVRYGTSSRVRFLVLSDSDPGETRTYVTEHALKFPVVCVTDESLIDAYNGRVMPQTALISPRGGIEQVWPGALEGNRQDQIRSMLDSLTM